MTRRRRRPSRLGVITAALACVTVAVIGVVAVRAVGAHAVHAKELAKARTVDPARIRQATRKITRPGTGGTTRVQVATTVSPVQWEASTVELTYAGKVRQYLQFRPATPPAAKLPVVMMISGSAKSAAGEAARSDFRQVATPAVLVYPQATDLSNQINWDAGACCGLASTTHIDDVGFLRAVVASVRAEPGVSSAPVALAGYSNGGKMALLLACDDPSLVAAVAVYGASPSFTCPHPVAQSLLELAGTADTELTIGPGGKRVSQNGFSEPRLTTVVDAELRLDRCTSATDVARVGGLDETTWVTCADGRQVGLGLWKDETHTWPETNGSTPSAQQVMWDWFVSLDLTGT